VTNSWGLCRGDFYINFCKGYVRIEVAARGSRQSTENGFELHTIGTTTWLHIPARAKNRLD
jgi:hypothetical protein